jgi:hypothetical protein
LSPTDPFVILFLAGSGAKGAHPAYAAARGDVTDEERAGDLTC